MSLPKEILEEKHPLGSFSDWVNTLHEIDVKVSKLHEVMVGNKEFGTEGIIEKLKNIENDLEIIKKTDLEELEKNVETLKSYKNKLMGFAIAGGMVWALVLKILEGFFMKK